MPRSAHRPYLPLVADDDDRLGHELSAAVLRFHTAIATRLALNVTGHKTLDEILYGDPATPWTWPADWG